MARIEKEGNNFPAEDNTVIPYLIKVVGNLGNRDDITKLKKIVSAIHTHELIMGDVQEALSAALAKLGDPEAVQTIENKLTVGYPEDRKDALEIIEYIDRGEWIIKVVPLLNDQSIAHQYSKGPTRIKIRVCDYAVYTLICIDHSKKFTVEMQGSHAYSDSDIEMVKQMYGLGSE